VLALLVFLKASPLTKRYAFCVTNTCATISTYKNFTTLTKYKRNVFVAIIKAPNKELIMPLVFNPTHHTKTSKQWRFIVGLLAILIACTVSNTAYADLTTGLVAHYCFDDANKIGKDCSGNGRDGTVYGSVSLANPPGATFNPSSSDNSGYIQAAPAINKNSSFTIFAWVKPTYIETIPSSAAPHTIVMERASGIDTCGSASYYNYALQIYTGKIGFFVYTTDCKSTLLFANSLAKLNQSIFLTAVYNNVAGTMSIYVDGKLDNTVAVGKTLHTTSNAVLRISKNSDIAKQPWHGQLDNIRIYDTALTDAEIATLAGVVVEKPIISASPTNLLFGQQPVGQLTKKKRYFKQYRHGYVGYWYIKP
jgi:hypothetical protein